jgi:Na+/alanine symporter
VAAVSIFTALVMAIVAAFDIRSAADAAHSRIPFIYLAYIVAALAWYGLRRKHAASIA